ncbi:hypothetical protein, partial [Ralstonia pseudosolanacearum]|uniref:hypothetical protein n=1 Tax=Ralstonia pseudosolanacearum TaxID=1310165 RepID=UPI003CF49C56
REYQVEQYNVRPGTDYPHSYAYETQNPVNHYHRDGSAGHKTSNNHQQAPAMEQMIMEVLRYPNVHETRTDHWVGDKHGRHNSVEHGNQGKYREGQHGKGDYLDYVSHIEKMPSMYPDTHHVQNHHDQVSYEEYVTVDEEYDPVAREMVQRRIITKVEKRPA